MKTFYIYHIPGIKIGCTTTIKERILRQQKYSYYEILEEHIDIFIASDREQELQKQFGYKVDTVPYWKSYKSGVNRTKKLSKEKLKKIKTSGGKEASIVNKKKGIGIYSFTKEQRKQYSKIAGEKLSKSVLVFDKLTGNYITEFVSSREAGRQLGISNIASIITGKIKTRKQYTFKYK